MEAPADGRLPQTVRPRLYEIRMTVAPEEKRFNGEVTIHVDLRKPAAAISLHALDLAIVRAEIEAGGKTNIAEFSFTPLDELITLKFPEAVPAGEARLRFIF
ncbi:MAG TPA: M1 family peptidase, partial [Nitrospiria bacterium]